MPDFTILITAVGSTTAISVIKSLGAQDQFSLRIIGCDIYPEKSIAGPKFCDAFYQAPMATSPDYVAAIKSICVREQVNLLIPIVDSELLVLARNRMDFDAIGTDVAVSNAAVIEICNDKLTTCQFLLDHGIPAPATMLAGDISDPFSLEYPVFVKPRDGVSSVNAIRVDSAVEFQLARQKIPNLVVQGFLTGDEFTIDVLVDPTGRAVASVPRRRLQTKAGICTKAETVHDELLINWGARVAEELGIRGPANIQGKQDGARVSFFEVNPRFSASLPLTTAAGINFPHWMLKFAKGESPPPGLLSFANVTMARYWEEVFHTL